MSRLIRLSRALIIAALVVCASSDCTSIGREFSKAEAPDIENDTQFKGTSFAGQPVGFGGATSPDSMIATFLAEAATPENQFLDAGLDFERPLHH